MTTFELEPIRPSIPALSEDTLRESTMRAGEPGLQTNGTLNRQVSPGTSPNRHNDDRELELEKRYKVKDKTQPSALSRLNDLSKVSPIEKENGALPADETFVIPSLEEDPENLAPKDTTDTSGPEINVITPITVIGARAIESSKISPNANDASRLRQEYGI